MENEIEKKVREICRKQWGVPQEINFDSRTTFRPPYKIFWRPHNYRRQIIVKTKTNSTIEKIKSAIQKERLTIIEHTKLIYIDRWRKQIKLQYGKNKLTAIYCGNVLNGEKEIYLLKSDSMENICSKIDEIVSNIKKQIDNALNSFIRKFDLRLNYKIKWERYEDFVRGESFIESIAEDVIIHADVFKKVYGKGIEFISNDLQRKPAVSMKNYLKNRSLEQFSPEIAKELNKIYSKLPKKTVYELYKEIILEAEGIDSMLQAMINITPKPKLNGFEKEMLENNIIERFGNGGR